MKKAFKSVQEFEGEETNEVVRMTKNLIFERRRLDLEEKQKRLRAELEQEIEKMNQASETVLNKVRGKSRENILDNFDVDDYTDSIDTSDDEEDEEDQVGDITLDDADDLDGVTLEQSNKKTSFFKLKPLT
jgi:hypothetical protein